MVVTVKLSLLAPVRRLADVPSPALPLRLALLSLPLLLAGCEAALDLSAVDQQQQQATRRTDFYQAMAANQRLLLVAGNDGVLLASRDGGDSWSRQQLAAGDAIIDLDACPDGSFIALGFDNRLWHADADGQRWSAVELPSEEQMMTAACAPDGAWWAAGSFSTLLSSRDQGANWTDSTLDEDAVLTGLQFLDGGRAVLTGEFGKVFSSANNGASWEPAGELPDEFYPHAAHFRSLEEGWVGGLNGFIYHTVDGGQNWQRQDTPSAAPVFGFVEGPQGLFAVGDHSRVLRLAGTRWEALPTPDAPVYLRAAALSGERLVVAGGRGQLLALDARQAPAAAQPQ